MKKLQYFLVVFSTLIYSLYRLKNTLSVEPFYDYFDSPQYFKLSIYPSFRLQGITFFFSLLKENDNIVIFQTLLGITSWVTMSSIFVTLISNKKLKIIFYLIFLYLGTTSVIIEHDSAILSESISISALTLLSATFTKFYFTNKDSFAIFTLLSIVFFSSTKSNNFLIAILIFALLSIIFLKRRSLKLRSFKFLIYILSALLIIFFTAVSLSSDITKTLTTSGTINNRIFLNDNWKNQTLQSGYPLSAYENWKYYSSGNFGSPADQAVVDRPDFKSWWRSGGENFLVNFTLKNPDYALISPFLPTHYLKEQSYKKSVLNGWSQGTDLIYNFEGFKNSIAIQTIFFPDQAEYSYLVLAIILLGIAVSILILWLYCHDNFSAIYISMYSMIVMLWGLVNWWFGSKPADMARHQLLAAISFRILIIISLVLVSKKIFDVIRQNDKA